jgi:hypothetical protein
VTLQHTAIFEIYRPARAAQETYAAAVADRQRLYLRALVKRAFPVRRPLHHDFACKTGRAIRMLHGLVREAHGYDTSPAMLAQARRLGTYARLHQLANDAEVPEPVENDSPVVVTVLGMPLDAGEPREAALAFATRALRTPTAGLLVLENEAGPHPEVVTELLALHGFGVVERRGFALLGRGWYGNRWLQPFARTVDDLSARMAWPGRWALNALYVARRENTAVRASEGPAGSG